MHLTFSYLVHNADGIRPIIKAIKSEKNVIIGEQQGGVNAMNPTYCAV